MLKLIFGEPLNEDKCMIPKLNIRWETCFVVCHNVCTHIFSKYFRFLICHLALVIRFSKGIQSEETSLHNLISRWFSTHLQYSGWGKNILVQMLNGIHLHQAFFILHIHLISITQKQFGWQLGVKCFVQGKSHIELTTLLWQDQYSSQWFTQMSPQFPSKQPPQRSMALSVFGRITIPMLDPLTSVLDSGCCVLCVLWI